MILDIISHFMVFYRVDAGGDLRRSTAKRFAEMDFDGYGLGGAFLKESLGDILRWCCEELPETSRGICLVFPILTIF